MKNKSERLLQIRKLIAAEKIGSQDELLSILISKGFRMTQATLSRDLKYLRVSKMYDTEKGYVYFLPEAEAPESLTPWSGFLIEGYVSLEFAQNLAIMKTLPGYAGSIASAIDSMAMVEVAGTIAGDDTIILIPRDGTNKQELKKQLGMVIPGL